MQRFDMVDIWQENKDMPGPTNLDLLGLELTSGWCLENSQRT